jgi:cell division protein FtsW (lipid II flippase)
MRFITVILLMLMVLLVDKFIDLPFVPYINNSRRWIRISVMGRDVVNIQPSEFCKVGFIIALAWYLRFREITELSKVSSGRLRYRFWRLC